MAPNLDKIKLGVLGFIAVGVLVTLILSIVTLVKVNEEPNWPTTTTSAPNGDSTTTSSGDTTTTGTITSTSTSATKTTNNPENLNIRTKAPIDPRENGQRYEAFKSYAETLHTSINTSYDPCDNFYEYACGSFNDDMDFDTIQDNNIQNLLVGLKKEPVGFSFFHFFS
ncbi:unnamed protein product [Bursaphelenchus okinawaensis]|uniref:Peptidase M13 N-terminal domain-containing protein n=1 Tax=Bursaphelenchus okinawaensis TaxID=465554 RepID=A0A811K1F7_9BILA|nr:unnamed protein product [Bursaphelenchus okinawaensis]CAG9088859.1 unnamed protein product [Bursaphelenchus okinawaensis]